MTVEFVSDEARGGFGWWCRGQIDHQAFFAGVVETAWSELRYTEEDLLEDGVTIDKVVDGYARENYNRRTDEATVSLSLKPNGGHRSTYVWVTP